MQYSVDPRVVQFKLTSTDNVHIVFIVHTEGRADGFKIPRRDCY